MPPDPTVLEQLQARVAALEQSLLLLQKEKNRVVELMTVDEAAAATKVSPRRISQAVQCGALWHAFPDHPRIHPQDLQDWWRRNKVKGRSAQDKSSEVSEVLETEGVP